MAFRKLSQSPSPHTSGLRHQNSNEIGVFCTLTNRYCLVAYASAQNSFSLFQSELAQHIPVIHASIGGGSFVGRVTVGNCRGLLVSSITTDNELQHLRNSLPDSIVIRRVEERLSALGNCIATNDRVALLHPDIEKETEELVQDVLGVETWRKPIENQLLVGSYARLNNLGGLVHVRTSDSEMEALADMLNIPVTRGTVNRGSDLVGSGTVVNDWSAFCGMESTAPELATIETIFKLSQRRQMPQSAGPGADDDDLRMQTALINSL